MKLKTSGLVGLTERIENRNAGRRKIRNIAGHHCEPVFKGSGGNLQIGSIMAQRRAELAPTPRRRDVERQNPLGINIEDLVEPRRQSRGEIRIGCGAAGRCRVQSRQC